MALYANDCKLYRVIKSSDDTNMLQTDLTALGSKMVYVFQHWKIYGNEINKLEVPLIINWIMKTLNASELSRIWK